MKNKLEKIKNEAGEVAVSALASANTLEQRDRALMLLGGILTTHSLSQRLAHETIKGIALVRDESLYEALGFARFDLCLDILYHENKIAFNYKRFNEREKLLKEHGEEIYDLMDSLNFPISRRKLLGAGNVQLDGETVIITTNKDGEETTEEIQLNDRTKLLQTLSALADQNFLVSSKQTKLVQKSEKDDETIKRLKKELDEAKNRPGEKSLQSLEFEAYMRASAAIDAWAEQVKKLTNDQKDHFAELYLDSIKIPLLRLQAAYDRNVFKFESDVPVKPKKNAAKIADSEDLEFAELAEVSAQLNEQELADLMK